MNIKRISQMLVMAIAISAGSAFAMNPGTDDSAKTKNAFVTWMGDHKWHLGIGATIAVATGLAIWKSFHDKKVKEEEAKNKKKARTTRQPVKKASVSRARGSVRRCSRGVCFR